MGSPSPSEQTSAPSQRWRLPSWDQSRSFEQPGETPTSHGGENYERMHSTSPCTIFLMIFRRDERRTGRKVENETDKERRDLTSNLMGKRKRPHQVAENAGESKEASSAQGVVGPAYGQVHELMPQVRLLRENFDLTFDLELAKAETPLSPKSSCKRLLRPYFAVSSLSGAVRLDDSLPRPRACWKAS